MGIFDNGNYLDAARGLLPGTSAKMGNTSQYDAYKKVAGTGLGATWGSQAGQTYMNGKKFQQTFDANGMGAGGYYTNDTGANLGSYQVDPTPIAKPSTPAASALANPYDTGYSYYDPEMDTTRPSAPTSTNNMDLSSQSAVLRAIGDSTQENRQRFNQVYDRIGSQANPYGTDTEGYRKGLTSARLGLTGQQNHDTAISAGRVGGVASGLRSAASDARSRDQAAAMAGLEGQMYNAERDRATNFDQSKSAALAALTAGDYSGTLSALDAIAKLPGQLGTQALQNEGMSLDNDASRQRIRSYAAQANMDEQTFQSELDAKKAQYAAAKAAGKQQEWEQSNAWWLGPLKAIYQGGVAVASQSNFQFGGNGQSGPAASAYSGYTPSNMA